MSRSHTRDWAVHARFVIALFASLLALPAIAAAPRCAATFRASVPSQESIHAWQWVNRTLRVFADSCQAELPELADAARSASRVGLRRRSIILAHAT